MAISLAKNARFLMLDTETIYTDKSMYELGFIVFDGETLAPLYKYQAYIKNTLESAIFYTLKNNGMFPRFWPNTRLDLFSTLKKSKPLQDVIGDLLNAIQQHNIQGIIAHNVNFDISAIYKTVKKYSPELYDNVLTTLIRVEKLELSGYFVHNLPAETAFDTVHKVKSGCTTFKADYIVPALLGSDSSQNHDALGDCLNQLALLGIVKGRYANTGTIYGNMVAWHKLHHNNDRHLGTGAID